MRYVISSTGISGADKRALQQQAVALGARFTEDFTTEVTHLVADVVGSAKYNVAREHKRPIVRREWLRASARVNRILDIAPYLLPPLAGVRLTITGERYATRTERDRVRERLEELGGEYCGELCDKVSHLLADGVSESDKLRAVEHGPLSHVRVVTEAWLESCARERHWLPERSFHPRAGAARAGEGARAERGGAPSRAPAPAAAAAERTDSGAASLRPSETQQPRTARGGAAPEAAPGPSAAEAEAEAEAEAAPALLPGEPSAEPTPGGWPGHALSAPIVREESNFAASHAPGHGHHAPPARAPGGAAPGGAVAPTEPAPTRALAHAARGASEGARPERAPSAAPPRPAAAEPYLEWCHVLLLGEAQFERAELRRALRAGGATRYSEWAAAVTHVVVGAGDERALSPAERELLGALLASREAGAAADAAGTAAQQGAATALVCASWVRQCAELRACAPAGPHLWWPLPARGAAGAAEGSACVGAGGGNGKENAGANGGARRASDAAAPRGVGAGAAGRGAAGSVDARAAPPALARSRSRHAEEEAAAEGGAADDGGVDASQPIATAPPSRSQPPLARSRSAPPPAAAAAARRSAPVMQQRRSARDTLRGVAMLVQGAAPPAEGQSPEQRQGAMLDELSARGARCFSDDGPAGRARTAWLRTDLRLLVLAEHGAASAQAAGSAVWEARHAGLSADAVTCWWVDETDARGADVDPSEEPLFSPLCHELPLGVLRGLKLSSTNLDERRRVRVQKLVEWLGGEYSSTFSRSCSLLLAGAAGGPKWDKARQLERPIVSERWLHECGRRGQRLEEGHFLFGAADAPPAAGARAPPLEPRAERALGGVGGGAEQGRAPSLSVPSVLPAESSEQPPAAPPPPPPAAPPSPPHPADADADAETAAAGAAPPSASAGARGAGEASAGGPRGADEDEWRQLELEVHEAAEKAKREASAVAPVSAQLPPSRAHSAAASATHSGTAGGAARSRRARQPARSARGGSAVHSAAAGEGAPPAEAAAGTSTAGADADANADEGAEPPSSTQNAPDGSQADGPGLVWDDPVMAAHQRAAQGKLERAPTQPGRGWGGGGGGGGGGTRTRGGGARASTAAAADDGALPAAPAAPLPRGDTLAHTHNFTGEFARAAAAADASAKASGRTTGVLASALRAGERGRRDAEAAPEEPMAPPGARVSKRKRTEEPAPKPQLGRARRSERAAVRTT